MAMLTASGFDVAELCCDYRGSGWSAASPRAIVIARRKCQAATIGIDRRCEPNPAVRR